MSPARPLVKSGSEPRDAGRYCGARVFAFGSEPDCGLALADWPVPLSISFGIVFAHGLAALGSGRMHRVALQRRDEGADVLHANGVEPAPFHAAPDGEEVGLGLVGAHELMAAFMRIDVELHRGGEAVDLLGVEDDEAGEGAAPTVEVRVQHRRPLAAIHHPAVDLERAMRHDLHVGPAWFT